MSFAEKKYAPDAGYVIRYALMCVLKSLRQRRSGRMKVTPPDLIREANQGGQASHKLKAQQGQEKQRR